MTFSVTDTLGQAAASIREHFKYFLGVGIFYYALNSLLLISLIDKEVEGFGLAFLISALTLVLYVKPAVLVHRTVILKQATEWKYLFTWGWPETSFFLLCIGMMIAFSLFNMIAGLVALPLFFDQGDESPMFMIYALVIMLFAGGAFSRVALMLPAFAVEQDLSVGDSIGLTENQAFKVFLLVVGLPILTAVILDFIFTLESTLSTLIHQFFAFLIIIFEVSVLSHTYIQLTDRSNPGYLNSEESTED